MTLVRTAKPDKKKEAAKFSLMDYRLLIALSLLLALPVSAGGVQQQLHPIGVHDSHADAGRSHHYDEKLAGLSLRGRAAAWRYYRVSSG